MDVLRRVVFPVIWMLIVAVIALALAKLAFFPADADTPAADPLTPSADFDQYALVAVAPEDISSVLELSALVQPDAGTELLATSTGEITRIWRGNGETVEKGQRVLQVKYEVVPEAVQAPVEVPIVGEDGQELPAPPPQPAAPEYRYVNLIATATGTLTGMTAAEGEDLTEDDVVATISPGTYSIIADLTPEQQLALLDLEIVATATLPTSADPVACAAPSITEDAELEEPAAPQTPEIDPFTGMPLESGGAGVSAAQLVCPVPAEARVVPGLSVEMSVDLGSRTGVLTVPTTAVEGEGTAGTVYGLDEATGEPMPIEVTLGLRGDGVVEVTEGLTEGQEILQFAPGVDNSDDMMGSEVW